MNTNSKGGLIELVMWCTIPLNASKLFEILRRITDSELLMAATRLGGAAGRVAWAEYGRRKGYFNFDIAVTRSEGRVSVSFEAKGAPAHDFPQYS